MSPVWQLGAIIDCTVKKTPDPVGDRHTRSRRTHLTNQRVTMTPRITTAAQSLLEADAQRPLRQTGAIDSGFRRWRNVFRCSLIILLCLSLKGTAYGLVAGSVPNSPFTQQQLRQAYLEASNAGEYDQFGYSVALDGGPFVVGAYQEFGDAKSTLDSPNENAKEAGATYVFTRQ